MKHPRALLKKKYVIGASMLLIAAVIGYFVFPRGPQTPERTISVVKGNITQEVIVTGNTKPNQKIDLAFEKSGVVRRVYTDIGSKVFTGQPLAELDQNDLIAQLAQANASADVARAKLNELKRGARPEDIQITRTALLKAEQDLANAYNAVPDVVNGAYSQTEDAVRKQLDPLFTNDEQSDVKISFTTNSSQSTTNASSFRARMNTELSEWKSELSTLNNTTSSVTYDQSLENTARRLAVARAFLDASMDAIQNSTSLDGTTLITYKSYVTTARTNVNAALTAVNDQRQVIAAEKISAQQAKDQLNLTLAGSDPQKIAAQESAVEEAAANAKNVTVQLGKTVLRSPLNGIVIRQDARMGQLAAANTVLISVISQGDLEIEANVPEADIAKIAVGNTATVTLDAYGNDTSFPAHIIRIDPAATVVEGVPTYKTTFSFDKEDSRIKPGMTANISFTITARENVLIIPQRFVHENEGKRFVSVLHPEGQTEEREITTGARSSEGDIEVVSGLSEGDEIAAYAK